MFRETNDTQRARNPHVSEECRPRSTKSQIDYYCWLISGLIIAIVGAGRPITVAHQHTRDTLSSSCLLVTLLLPSRLFRARAIMHAQKNPRETIMPRVTVRSKGVSNSIVFFLSLSLSPFFLLPFPPTSTWAARQICTALWIAKKSRRE